MVTFIDNLQKNDELLSYYDSFDNLQIYLTYDKAKIHIDSINQVIKFIKEGTKNRRKNNFLAYFADIDIEWAKELAQKLEELKVAVVNSDIDLINKLKGNLTELGMLMFNQKYLDVFSDQLIIEEDRPEKTNNLQRYLNWLQNDVSELIAELENAYYEDSMTVELLEKFSIEFKKYLGGKLLLKIISKDTQHIVGVPIHLHKNGYDILTHPFLVIDWSFQCPIQTLRDGVDINEGDILSVNFSGNKNERYFDQLIFINFNSAEVIPQTLRQALSDYVDNDFIEQAYKVFEIEDKNDELLTSILTHKLLTTSREVRKGIIKAQDEIKNEKILSSQIEYELNEKRREWYRILKRIDEMIDIEEEVSSYDNNTYEKHAYSPEQFIKNLQSLIYHNDEQYLIYKTGVLKSFVYSLQANILTLLTGPSGTGKSSLVQAYGRAVENVVVKMIPVQSNWTDAQDLLGYFHPLDKAYIPTPFMEVLAEAAQEENKSKLYLICLDEMNLAHIEYYFSEILSAREEKNPKIQLYPKRYFKFAKHILEDKNATSEQKQNAAEIINLYPATFKIPDNVRIIGTLNMDHTVKPLSPKVIDRSFIIEINHLTVEDKEKIVSELKHITGKIEMNYETFKQPTLDESVVERGVENILKISRLLEDYPNASLNSRGIKHIRKFLTYAKDEQEINELLDYIIIGKLLPRIEIKKDEIDSISSNNILKELSPYSQAEKRFVSMLKAKQIVKFW